MQIRLKRYEPAESLDQAIALAQLLTEDGEFKRDLKPSERAFIRNERILTQQDFYYWLRYCAIIRDGVEGGGLGTLNLWESQKVLMTLIEKLEERNIEMQDRGGPCDGILICDNKGGRQLGHTMIGRAITMHRLTTWNYTRAMGASIDEDKLLELYDRDKLILDNLPFFLKPKLEFDKKGEHISFLHSKSRILYQQAKQQSGIGTGRQFDINHNTEISTWPYPRMLEMDFFPTLPQHPYTFSLQETTPAGRGNWWFIWSQRVREGRIPRWAYLYIPFYAEPKKYRRTPPANWNPSEDTLAMAKLVYDTSPEFVGKAVILTRDQMYWWESSYREAQENNSLNLFLSNYSVTPDQSFQHTTLSAFKAEVLDKLRMQVKRGAAYEVSLS